MSYSTSGAKVRYVEEDEDNSDDEGILLPSSVTTTCSSTPSMNIPMPFNLVYLFKIYCSYLESLSDL